MLAPATLAALPSTRATANRDVFYVAFPKAPLYLAHSRSARPLLRFPFAVPGFLDALAAVGTSRRKVNSHQRLTALPAMSLIPRAPLFSFESQLANEREVI